jgi:hypothetical protein
MTDISPFAGSPTGGPSRPTGSLRLGAYLLLGDPAFLEQSIRSIYAIAERIVVVYDEAGLSWTKQPLPIEACLATVERMDPERKVELLPGAYHDTGLLPLQAETLERNAGVAALSNDVDWVVQIDTDEVLGDPDRFVRAIERAHAEGRSALDYPARWLYGHVSGNTYLERCRRTWGISAGYPGPMAVKAGTTLRLARQCDVPLWRIDFRRRNTDPAHPRNTRVDELVRPEEGIWHFSWVRSEQQMRNKAASSGHVDDVNWGKEIDRWLERCRHPHLTTLLTPVRRPPAVVGAPTWLRTARVPASVLVGAE